VEVAVNEAGQEAAALGVDHARGWAAPAFCLGVAAHKHNALAAHGHGFGARLAWVGGENVGVGDKQVGELGHGASGQAINGGAKYTWGRGFSKLSPLDFDNLF
jgi:hypothetical protein